MSAHYHDACVAPNTNSLESQREAAAEKEQKVHRCKSEQL